MHLDLEYPWVLAAAPLALLPWLATPLRGAVYASLALFPQDAWSSTVGWVLRIAGTAALLALLLGIAGLYRTEQTVQRIGHGAHIVLVLDRSSSMDDTFAEQAPSGGEESKARAARRFLDVRPRRAGAQRPGTGDIACAGRAMGARGRGGSGHCHHPF